MKSNHNIIDASHIKKEIEEIYTGSKNISDVSEDYKLIFQKFENDLYQIKGFIDDDKMFLKGIQEGKIRLQNKLVVFKYIKKENIWKVCKIEQSKYSISEKNEHIGIKFAI